MDFGDHVLQLIIAAGAFILLVDDMLVRVVDFFICAVEDIRDHFTIYLINCILNLLDQSCSIPSDRHVRDKIHLSL